MSAFSKDINIAELCYYNNHINVNKYIKGFNESIFVLHSPNDPKFYQDCLQISYFPKPTSPNNLKRKRRAIELIIAYLLAEDVCAIEKPQFDERQGHWDVGVAACLCCHVVKPLGQVNVLYNGEHTGL